MVDNTVTSMSIILSGEKCSLVLLDPSGKPVDDTSIVKKTINLENFKVFIVK